MPEKEELASVELYRFDPEVDAAPRYSTFRVPYKGLTVVNVLSYIYENLDSSFAFRWACGKGYCRGCILQVNGKPVMGCTQPATKHMRIEPHPKFKVVKDLIVDFDRLRDEATPVAGRASQSRG